MGINRQYKNSVFSLLFSNPAVLLELYEALEGVTLPPGTPVTINTLESALYRTFLNDISFLIANRLIVLAEHQSTINPNMALRMLIYIARLLDGITIGKNLYGKKKIIIPVPECFVLYNGVEPYPNEVTLKLSDLFEDISSLHLPTNRLPCLDLSVKVININKGRNEPVISRCETLNGYSTFIAKIREYEGEIARSKRSTKLTNEEKLEAMKKAINWCIGQGILKDFLEIHRTEVTDMLFDEWKLEDALVVEREEGREEGREVREMEIARTALAEGASLDFIRKITGLNKETIERLSGTAENYLN